MPKLRGIVDFHFETGSEGLLWIFVETSNEEARQREPLVLEIEKGDHLKIFSQDGSVVFDGKIDPDHKAGYTPYSANAEHGQPSALGFWIHWTQKSWKPDEWAKLFLHKILANGNGHLKAELTKKTTRKRRQVLITIKSRTLLKLFGWKTFPSRCHR